MTTDNNDRAALLPCPFCGGAASFERMGTPRQSCIVTCDSCGARHESSDEGHRSGTQWNERAASPEPKPAEVPASNEEWEMGKWLSAALDDPGACDEFKADIRRWMEARAWGAAAPSQASVPAGWKLVPVETTEKMRSACRAARAQIAVSSEGLWRAFLAAAPQAPQENKQ
jgi:Lar family restriction alleviation protein